MAKTEGRTGLTGGASSDASFDVMAQADNALERRVVALEAGQRSGRRRALTTITPGNPFITSQTPGPKGIITGCAIELPPSSGIDWITAIYRQTGEPASKNREQTWRDIPQSAIDSNHFEGTFDKELTPSTGWGLVALIAKGDFPNSRKTRNPDPPDDANFLTTWNSISMFPNDPSKPDTGLILENNFDLVTKAFDAFVVVRIYAPINGLLTAYTGSVTLNSTVTVVGTQSFVGQVTVGMLIIVSGQTREVTNVAGATITVDRAFRTGGAGLELLFGQPHTWKTALVTRVTPRFRLTNDASAYALKPPHDISDDEQNQTHLDMRINGFVAARKYDWVQNLLIAESGRRHVFPDTTQTFTAGGFTSDTPGLPQLTGVAYQYDATEPYDDTLRYVSVVATQPNPPIALDTAELRRYRTGTGTVQISAGVMIGSGTTFLTDLLVLGEVIVGGPGGQTVTVTNITDNTHASVSGSVNTGAGQEYAISGRILDEKNLRRHRFHPETGGQIRIGWGELALKRLRKFIFRTKFTSQVGNTRTVDDNFTTGGTGPLDGDTAAPGAPIAPDCQTFIDGNVKVEVELPATNVQTFVKFQVVMSTQATAPLGDPTVGLEGVKKIRKGHTGFFEFQRPLTDISTVTYYFYARVLNAINWGPWSLGTSVLGSTIGRPIEDGIGSGVPILPIRLERSATSGSGHTGTTFVLDAFASGVTDAYKDMFLHVPGEAANNRVRRITAYNGLLKIVQVVGFDSVPANNQAYEIHAGLTFGEKSGTGHTTTTFKLGAAPNTIDDYTGYALYFPAQAAVDQIRRINSYVPATKTATIDAVAVASSNSDCYMMSRGTFGYQNQNPLSGIISGVPARVYLDDPKNVIEILPGTDENWFSVDGIELRNYRKSNGVFKNEVMWNPSIKANQSVGVSSSFVPVWQFRIHNGYRGGGSTGWSLLSAYFEGFQAGTSPSVVYDPAAYPQPEIDFGGPGSYPSSRFPSF